MRIKYYISIIVITLLLACYLNTIYIHLLAYINGRWLNRGYEVTIYTNNYGEADLEMFILYFGLILIIYYFTNLKKEQLIMKT